MVNRDYTNAGYSSENDVSDSPMTIDVTRNTISKIVSRRPRLGISQGLSTNSSATTSLIKTRSNRTASKRRKIAPTTPENCNSNSNAENRDSSPLLNNSSDQHLISLCKSPSGNNGNSNCSNHKLSEQYIDEHDTNLNKTASSSNICNKTTDITNEWNDLTNAYSNSSSTDFDSRTMEMHNIPIASPNISTQSLDSGVSVSSSTLAGCSRKSVESSRTPSEFPSSSREAANSILNTPTCDDKVNKNKNSINFLYQKMARVRRNYRTKYADGSESD